MIYLQKRSLVITSILLAFFPGQILGGWKKIDNGLELGSFLSPQPATRGDSTIRVLRIDQHRYKLKLLNASSSKEGRSLSAKEWCLKYNLRAVINASMYQKDQKTSVFMMRQKGHINNSRLSRDKAILAFDPRHPGGPSVRLIDRQCDNFELLKNRYRTLIQSIRMISCRGANVWQQQPEQWSTAALALDSEGRILFIHVASPYSTHDLINILQLLPLSIDRAMYLEGGPEAQMFIQGNNRSWEFFGSYGTTFTNSAPPGYSWPIPNIIGISQKSPVSEDQ